MTTALYVAAALGLALVATIGVVQLAPLMIRVTSPDGTLVVEVDDPAVKVTVEDSGKEIVITGPAIKELRLRPGPHRIEATRDGKPMALKDDVIVITQGEKQKVKVTREAPKQLTAEEKLEQAKLMWDEANELYTKGGGLRSSDPWEAERCLRRALSLNEKLVADFPGTTKYKQRIGSCKWALASALNMQVHLIVFKNPPANAAEARRAVELGKEAVALTPQDPGFLPNLGRAYYRAGDFKAAREALEKSFQGGNPHLYDQFFLAMTCWQLGDKDKAREWYAKGMQALEKNPSRDTNIARIRAEATELIRP